MERPKSPSERTLRRRTKRDGARTHLDTLKHVYSLAKASDWSVHGNHDNEIPQMTPRKRAVVGTTKLLLNAKEVASTLGISERQVWRLDGSGLLPEPTRIGRIVRWYREELVQWVARKSPPRSVWERQRE